MLVVGQLPVGNVGLKTTVSFEKDSYFRSPTSRVVAKPIALNVNSVQLITIVNRPLSNLSLMGEWLQ